MGKLQEKIAIVTGSDSGIGRAIAVAFAREGAAVTVTWHSDEEGAKETLKQVEGAGGRGIVRHLDIADESSVEALFKATDAELGRIDILVNNAGMGKGGATADLPTEVFDQVVKTDLYGPFFCARAFIQRRREVGGRGKLINITSVHDTIPSPASIPYSAAKGGLLTVTRSLALELAPLKINVNAVAPGQIRTPMTEDRIKDPEKHAEEMKNIPWGRPGEPEEVAALVLYLASDDSDYVTGQGFVIDGGLEMNWGQGA
ncbi:MAG: SDR family oxidoreductase [Fimbriimonas sp.]